MKDINAVVLISIIFLSSRFYCIRSEQVRVDTNGGTIIETVISATLHNTFDFEISVYYELGHGGEKAFLANINAGGTTPIQTYHGHVFHATRIDANILDIIASVSVVQGETDYFFLGRERSAESSTNVQTNTEMRSRLHPAVQLLSGSPTTAMSARFRSLSSRKLDLFFEDGRGGSPQGSLGPGQDSTTNAYEGHVFFYTPHRMKHIVLGRVTMIKTKVLYVLKDDEFPGSQSVLDYTAQEEAYMTAYLNRTGIHWRGFYGRDGPRDPPRLHMWPADNVGQVHRVNSSHGFWSCDGPSARCQSKLSVPLELEVISRKPRAFIIPNFLSDFEANAVIEIARPQIKESTVGNDDGGGVRKSSTRTSSNTWIGRKRSAVTETLYLRAADVLKVNEKLLNTNANSEEMQVVYYQVGQKYDAHHDWGVNGYPEARFITLLLYLSDKKHSNAGGETSFPKAAGGRGIKVHPGKGSAVLFYNLLEDGNCDDLALHEATPVRDGEKWLSNFWVWDPKRK